ncbi:hypothetical protein LEP1GSC038_1137 [Leptospira weilii str. 2006001855]|uniref:Uncharacterized protein n=1 Tax=Leptospira weilii str. 2006001855 TaxID=996804 RepID=M6FCT9_9LEPT|nr:hypothetical protein LEP1GSC051_0648 [Leptospira sp. P2653]EMM70613.1 hypothetical protein LEP1GSC038_1137 [Leptospira weilii str. 2006001855]
MKVGTQKRISNYVIFELNEKREGSLKESNVSLAKRGVESFDF